jgi:hypothetical protein
MPDAIVGTNEIMVVPLDGDVLVLGVAFGVYTNEVHGSFWELL